MKITKYLLLITCALLALTACKSKKMDDDAVVPIDELYSKGEELIAKRDYKEAAQEFEKIFFQHPGNEKTPQAELMQGYALYLEGEYDEVVDVMDTFIKLHPRHVDIAYAYYMKALANYVQVSEVDLDQSRTKYAKEGFQEIIARFPGSKYAIDAALKIDLVDDHLAGKEMVVGRFYLKHRNPIAAMKRFQAVIDQYDDTRYAAEALYRLVESTMLIGLRDEAEKFASVLGHNHPDSSWYKKSYSLLKVKSHK